MSRRGAFDCSAGYRARKFPAASIRTSAPSGSIHREISSWHFRMAGHKNGRRVLPRSSEKEASLRHRSMTSPARVVISVVCTEVCLGLQRPRLSNSGLSYHLGCGKAEKNENNQNFPAVLVPIGRDRKMIADHDKNNWNRQESIVFGSQLGLSPERGIKFFSCRCYRDHSALRRQNSEPNVGRHNRSEDCPEMNVGRATAECVSQSPGEHGDHQYRECAEHSFRLAES